jgi:non-specific serine/threonine protein kinase/serine/threonine-protein kinase
MAADPRRVKELFVAALDLTDAQGRQAFLEQECRGDADLRQRLEALLRAHDQPQPALDQPLAAVAAAPTGPATASADSLAEEQPGAILAGKYKLIERIGEGGMGSVWMAQQTEPVKRTVAVKFIKGVGDSKAVLARFEAERQALALMDHPNIARVLDAGTTERGSPFFVMELVKGVPITQFCDARKLTPRQRLELFVPVCQAIQHAHQKGIIHRDVKPSNVLVALYDDRPVPKVIDFGLAKATGTPLTEQTLHTGFGALVGTPQYMSPEQATLNNLDIDTRSDIYSLGVLLYELLTGSPPFRRKDLEKAGMLEVLRVIREEEPSKPSTKVSTADALPSLAADRGTEPAKLTRLLRGEIDWMVMKALEKERSRRYETANGFAMDIQRYLADEPVQAGPPSAAYRLRKFVKRHKARVVAAGLVLLALVAGMVGTTLGLLRATQAEQKARAAADEQRQAKEAAVEQRNRAEKSERDEKAARLRAEEQAAIVRAVNEFVQKDLLGQADVANQPGSHRGRNPDVTVRTLLDRASRNIEGKFKDQPLTEAAIRLTLADTYWNLAQYEDVERHLLRSIELRTAKLGADDSDTLTSKNSLATLYQDLAQYGKAEALFKEVLRGRTARLGADHPDTISSQNNLGLLYLFENKYDLAEPLLQEALKRTIARDGPHHKNTSPIKCNLAILYQNQEKYDKAEPLLLDVLRERLDEVGPDHVNTLNSKHNLASLYMDQKKYDKAQPLFEQVVQGYLVARGADHPDTLYAKNGLATLYFYQGKYDQAEVLLRDALKGLAAKLGANHPTTRTARDNLVQVYLSQEKYDRAEPLCRELVASARRESGAASAATASRLALLGLCLLKQDKHAEAETVLTECLAIREKKQLEEWATFNTRSMLGGALLGQKKYADAEPLLTDGYEGMYKRRDKIPEAVRHLRLTEALERLVQLYEATGEKDKADQWRKKRDEAKTADKP